MYQYTLKSPIHISGIGVHSGLDSKISILPASEDYGIMYRKMSNAPDADNDASETSVIAADYKNVTETTMCTRISNKYGVSIAVVEHLSAAFYALGISNALVKVYGNEIPLLDGSSLPFIEKIMTAGIVQQSKKRKQLRILKQVKTGDEKKWSSLSPSDTFVANVKFDFSSKNLITGSFSFNINTDDFVKDIAAARTFGFLSDVEFLQKNNLALGASLGNTVVFDDNGKPINKGGLRYPDEPVRHKLLDVIGDLSLAGFEILGRYDGFCSGHKLNNQMLAELFYNKDNFEII